MKTRVKTHTHSQEYKSKNISALFLTYIKSIFLYLKNIFQKEIPIHYKPEIENTVLSDNIKQSHKYFSHHPKTMEIMKNKIHTEVYYREFQKKYIAIKVVSVLSWISLFLWIQSITNTSPFFFSIIVCCMLNILCTKALLKELHDCVYSAKNRFLFFNISKSPLNYNFIKNELWGRDYIFSEKE